MLTKWDIVIRRAGRVVLEPRVEVGQIDCVIEQVVERVLERAGQQLAREVDAQNLRIRIEESTAGRGGCSTARRNDTTFDVRPTRRVPSRSVSIFACFGTFPTTSSGGPEPASLHARYILGASYVMHRLRLREFSRRCLVALILAGGVSACAKAPSRTSELAVRRVWDEYLASKSGQFAMNAGKPSPLWSASEQTQWSMYDLAGFYLSDNAVPEVLSVTSVNAKVDSAYRIVTRFWPEGTTARDSSTKPELTMTTYARREDGRWVLANALPYSTSSRVRETRGRVTYRVAPALRFDDSKAVRAAAFVDSLATAFGVAPPPRLDYYVAESVDQALAILGVVIPQRFGAAGGFAKPVNFQVFSGIPALGEEYRHEIAHVVLLPINRGSSTSLIASEGVPTWFGGTAGRDYIGSVRHLDLLLSVQPQLGLDKIVEDMGVSPDIRNSAGAVLAEMVHEVGGVDAVREYLRTPGSGIREVLTRLLQRPWTSIVEEWRRRVDRIAAT